MAGGSKPLAEIFEEVSVTGVQLLPKVFGGLMRFLEIAIDLLPVVQVVGYGRVDLGKR
ncbi:MAG: hypothetical protein ACREQ7_13475 [Candidatus Binatia bacterium]